MIRFSFKEPAKTRRHEEISHPPPRESWMARMAWRLISIVFLTMVRRYQHNAMNFMKIQATAYYVRAVGKARRALMGYIGFSCAMLLLLAGFIILHIGFFTFFNWSNRVKGGVLFILGVVYFAVALGVILYALREKTWMRYSGAGQMVEKVTKEAKPPKTGT
jgi:hypothetical protein